MQREEEATCLTRENLLTLAATFYTLLFRRTGSSAKFGVNVFFSQELMMHDDNSNHQPITPQGIFCKPTGQDCGRSPSTENREPLNITTFSMSIYAAFNCRDQSPCAILWFSQQLSPLPNPRSLSLPATSTPGVLLAGSLAWLLASAFAQVLLLFCPCAFALTFSFYLHLKTLHVTWASWTRSEISSQK